MLGIHNSLTPSTRAPASENSGWQLPQNSSKSPAAADLQGKGRGQSQSPQGRLRHRALPQGWLQDGQEA